MNNISQTHIKPAHKIPPYPQGRKRRVWKELKNLGMSWAALRTMEGRYLPHIIHDGEHIGGVVYGWSNGSFAMLAATDRRVIFLDRKPLFTDEDEISYDIVSGVDYGSTGLDSTLTLHTRVKDYKIYTFNDKSARGFIDYIESRAIERPPEKQ